MICGMMAVITDIRKSILNLVFPLHCLACRAPVEESAVWQVCGRCLDDIRPNPRPWCRRCGRSVDFADALCRECRKMPGRHFKRNYSAYLYDGALKECIHKFKYGGISRLSGLFSSLLIDFIKDNPEILKDIDLLVPVPLGKNRLRERGYNQSSMLTRPISEEFGVLSVDALAKKKSTPPQSELKRESRLINLKGAFEMRPDISVNGKNILIIDDVFTTGSTINECASVLKDAGAGRIYSLTLARGHAA